MSNAQRPAEPWIGIQIGAQTLYDEGIEHALDLLNDTCHLNALVVSAFGGGTHNGQWAVPPANRADHGVPLPNPPHEVPAAWVNRHEEHYRGLRFRWPDEPENHYGDRDILDDLAQPAAERGMALYPRMFQCRVDYPRGMIDEVDADGRPTGKRCVNSPEWNEFSRASAEDLAVHHPQVAGFMYLQERNGPLDEVFSRGATLEHVGHCFCDHCNRKAHAEGIDVERARRGYRLLTDLAVAARSNESRPSDGWFVSFLRLLTRFPEIGAWDAFWWESLHRHRQGIYRAIKAVRSDIRVGWHLHHPMSFNVFYRVGMDFSRIAQFSDWVKPNVYPGASGGRSRRAWVNNIMQTLFKDLRPEIAIGLLYDVLGYDPSQMPTVEEYLSDGRVPGWGPEYVLKETRRALAVFAPKVDVYPGLGFDMPGNQDTPNFVKECTHAVFEAGAPGVLISREYEEIKVEHLEAIGAAMAERGLV